MPSRFSARRHVPHYSRLLFTSLVEPIVIFLVLSGNVVLALAATAFYRAEHGINPAVEHPFDAVWWAFATVTTVGYGDVAPVTTAGRVVAIFLMVSGISLFVGFSGFLVSIISSKATQELQQKVDAGDTADRGDCGAKRKIHPDQCFAALVQLERTMRAGRRGDRYAHQEAVTCGFVAV